MFLMPLFVQVQVYMYLRGLRQNTSARVPKGLLAFPSAKDDHIKINRVSFGYMGRVVDLHPAYTRYASDASAASPLYLGGLSASERANVRTYTDRDVLPDA